MNDYWSRGWGDYNSHLRVSGQRLIEWADQVGWSLYPHERASLEEGADVEIFLELPLDELDVVAFGAAVQKLSERVDSQQRRAQRRATEQPPERETPKTQAGGKPKSQDKQKRRRSSDDQRSRRWR
ncbi:MAG: hypothetical protein U0556_14280 [Dehalococcoidia bacterium]